MLYDEHKPYLAPALAVGISIILFLFLIIPQIFSLSQKRNLADGENQKLSELVAAKNIAAGTDLTQLASNLSLANAALPPSKDFESIISTLSTVAADSNVTIESYQFQDIASSSQTQLANFPALTFSINLIGSPSQIVDFISGLYQHAPLSEIESISQNENSATVSVAFFYKPFSSVSDSSNIQIGKMKTNEANALNTISQWDIATFQGANLPESTESAQESGSPF